MNVLSIFARSQFFSRLIWIRKLLCFFLSANVHTLCNMAECFYLYNQQMHAVKTLLDFRYTHQTLNHNQFISRIFAWIVTGRLTVKHAQTECDQMWPDSKQNTKKKNQQLRNDTKFMNKHNTCQNWLNLFELNAKNVKTLGLNTIGAICCSLVCHQGRIDMNHFYLQRSRTSCSVWAMQLHFLLLIQEMIETYQRNIWFSSICMFDSDTGWINCAHLIASGE